MHRARRFSSPLAPLFIFIFQGKFIVRLLTAVVARGSLGRNWRVSFPFFSRTPSTLLSFSLYSSAIQDFYRTSFSIFPQPGCYMPGTTCGKYETVWNTKIENRKLLRVTWFWQLPAANIFTEITRVSTILIPLHPSIFLRNVSFLIRRLIVQAILTVSSNFPSLKN